MLGKASAMKAIALIAVIALTSPAAHASAGRPVPRTPYPVTRTAGGRLVAIPSGRGARLALASDRSSPFTSVFGTARITTAAGLYSVTVQAFRVDDPGWRSTEVFISFGRGFGSLRGPHERFAIQDHSYDAEVPRSAFTWSGDLSRATVDTGSSLGHWGRIRLRFAGAGDLTSSCHGNTTARDGGLTGTFSFTPRHDNGFFGTVRKARFRHAELSSSTCGSHFPTGDGSCPTQPTIVDALAYLGDHGFASFFASSFTDGRPTASAIYQQFYGNISVYHELWVNDSVRVHDDGVSALFRVKSKIGLRGVATATPNDRLQTSDPYPCGDGQQVIFTGTSALVTPGPGQALTAGFDTGAISLPADGLPGDIVRELVTDVP